MLNRVFFFLINPIFIPVYMALTIMYAFPSKFAIQANGQNIEVNPDVKLLYLIALVVVFPAVFLFLLKRLEIISDYSLKDKSERFLFMIALGSFWLWAYYMFSENSGYPTASYKPMGLMLLGCIASLFILFPVNFSAKVDFYMLGLGGFISMIMNIFSLSERNLWFITFITFLAILYLLYYRIKENKYSKNGLIISLIIGFFGQFFAFQIWGRLFP